MNLDSNAHRLKQSGLSDSLASLNVELSQVAKPVEAAPELVVSMPANPPARIGSPKESRTHNELVLDLLYKDDFDIDEFLGEVSRSDHLETTLLRSANSAEFSLEFEVKNVRHAAAVLGQRRLVDLLQKLVLAEKAKPTIPRPHFRSGLKTPTTMPSIHQSESAS